MMLFHDDTRCIFSEKAIQDGVIHGLENVHVYVFPHMTREVGQTPYSYFKKERKRRKKVTTTMWQSER